MGDVLFRSLETLFMWQLWLGAFIGFVLQRIECHQKAHWANKHHPLPDGMRHHANPVSKQWVAGLAAALSLLYFLLSTERTHRDTVQLAARMVYLTNQLKVCTAEYQHILADRGKLSDDSDQMALDSDNATLRFNQSVSNPPANIAQLPYGDPVRQEWFHELFVQWNNETQDNRDQRQKAINERRALKYPPSQCNQTQEQLK